MTVTTTATLVQTVIHGRQDERGEIVWDNDTRRAGLVPAENRARIIRREIHNTGTMRGLNDDSIIFRTFPHNRSLADHYTQILWDEHQGVLL